MVRRQYHSHQCRGRTGCYVIRNSVYLQQAAHTILPYSAPAPPPHWQLRCQGTDQDTRRSACTAATRPSNECIDGTSSAESDTRDAANLVTCRHNILGIPNLRGVQGRDSRRRVFKNRVHLVPLALRRLAVCLAGTPSHVGRGGVVWLRGDK